ncbi:MAG: hypothetical protein HY069_03145 [Chlamydiia bacterium]|nr:hypothetical protein [Chlamydiia bacterium]
MSVQGPPNLTPELAATLLAELLKSMMEVPSALPEAEGQSPSATTSAIWAEKVFVPPDSKWERSFVHTVRQLLQPTTAMSTSESPAPPSQKLPDVATSRPSPTPSAKQKEAPAGVAQQEGKPFFPPSQVRLAMQMLTALVPKTENGAPITPEKLKALVQELIQAVGRKEMDRSDGKAPSPFPHATVEKKEVKKTIPFVVSSTAEKEKPPEKITEKRQVAKEEAPKMQESKSSAARSHLSATFSAKQETPKTVPFQPQPKEAPTPTSKLPAFPPPQSRSVPPEPSKSPVVASPQPSSPPLPLKTPGTERGASPSMPTPVQPPSSLPPRPVPNSSVQPLFAPDMASKSRSMGEPNPTQVLGPFVISPLAPIATKQKKKTAEEKGEDEAEQEEKQ